MERELNFRIEKETPGALQYKEYANGQKVDQHAATIGTLYLRKLALSGDKPSTLKVTVSY